MLSTSHLERCEEIHSVLAAHALADPAEASRAGPAVCDTLVGTQRIPDGAQVTVDGTQGTVDIHAAGSEQISRD
jgi:phosphohistidine swiveling domain-containing protein